MNMKIQLFLVSSHNTISRCCRLSVRLLFSPVNGQLVASVTCFHVATGHVGHVVNLLKIIVRSVLSINTVIRRLSLHSVPATATGTWNILPAPCDHVTVECRV